MLRPPALEAAVYEAVAALCRLDAATLGPTTSLLEINADSLTLIAVVASIEAAYSVSLDERLSGVLEARTLGELHAALARGVSAALGTRI